MLSKLSHKIHPARIPTWPTLLPDSAAVEPQSLEEQNRRLAFLMVPAAATRSSLEVGGKHPTPRGPARLYTQQHAIQHCWARPVALLGALDTQYAAVSGGPPFHAAWRVGWALTPRTATAPRTHSSPRF